MKTIVVWLCAFLTLSGVALAEDKEQFERKWGFGWDEGLTLRRQLGVWQIGLSAGPNDYRDDRSTDRFDPDYPDSLNGSPIQGYKVRRESGYVYLELARELVSRRNLEFSGTVGGMFNWNDFKAEEATYYVLDGETRMRIDEYFSKEWRLRVGAKLAWFVLPWLSVEKKFGLVYLWEEEDRTDWDKGRNDIEWTRDVRSQSYQSFNSFGTTSLTYEARIIFWF
jgi:hypothetical protein